MGVFQIIFVKDALKTKIRKVETEVVKTGFHGKLGNKGGVLIKFKLYDSYMNFTSAHLAAGEKHVPDQLKDLKEIENMKQSNRKQEYMKQETGYKHTLRSLVAP